MEYYPGIKRNEIGSPVETWMDIESVTQSEVNRKKENEDCIVTHIWNLEKWYDDPICREGIEAQTENKFVNPAGKGEGGTNWERSTDTYTIW